MRKLLSTLLVFSVLVFSGCKNEENTDTIEPPDMPDYSGNLELCDYKNLSYTLTGDYEITDDDFQRAIESICIDAATLEPITDRAAADNDYVTIMYNGHINGKTFANSSTGSTGISFRLGTGGGILDLLTDHIIGMKPDESKSVKIDIPEDYSDSDIAGQTVDFTIYLAELDNVIFETPIDDATVKKYTDYDSIAEIKQAMLENVSAMQDFEIYNGILSQIIDKTVFNSYPDGIIDELVERAVTIANQNADNAGLTVEEYLKQSNGVETLDEFQKAMQSQAEQYMQIEMITVEIAKAENITVTPEEFTEYKTNFATEHGYADIQSVNMYYTDAELLTDCLEPKVRQWLIDNSDIPNRVVFEELTSSDSSNT